MYNSKLVKSIIGAEVYEVLTKSIVKLNSKSVVDISELHDALKIVPKSVIAFLLKNTEDIKKDGSKEIKLPWAENTSMLINKMDSDVYKGHIVQDSKVIHEFDLCSIPQLGAHMLSLFEIYDDTPQEQSQETKEESKKEHADIEAIKVQIASLDNKINALIMLAAGKPAVQPTDKKSDLAKALKSLQKTTLKKAGLAPSMPKPPRPGVHSGSQQGISQSGFHGPKTAHSDLNATGGQSQTRLNPNLKSGASLSAKNGLPQQPKQPKTSFTMKSESSNSKCLDCGEPDMVDGKFRKCSCFKVLSNPDVKKNDNGTVTFKMATDWDQDSIKALWNSLRKIRD